MTVYGRQETFENAGEQWRINGWPTPQWERIAAGISDNLSPSGS